MSFFANVPSVRARYQLSTDAKFPSVLASRLYEAGFKAISDDWVTGDYIIFNRSQGAKSNFFIFVDISKGKKINVLFTDPRDDEKAIELKRDQLIVKMQFDNADEKKVGECLNRILNASNGKKENEYYIHTHGHMGEIYNPVEMRWENIWDDGISKDIENIRQAMLWNFDVYFLTSHNWAHNKLRLGWLNREFGACNITFGPGVEITMPYKVNDKEGKLIDVNLWLGPHILVYFANMDVAMKIQYELLAEKLRQNTGKITPILCGPPIEIEKQLEFLRSYHDAGLVAIAIAHPFSKLPGIDIFDPAVIKALGYEKIWNIVLSDIVDAIEEYNGAEYNCELDFSFENDKDNNERKEKMMPDVAAALRNRLRKAGFPDYLSPPNLNRYVGEFCKKFGKFAFYGHDDHAMPPLGDICVYAHGHTKLTIPDKTFSLLKSEDRKLTAAEIVKAISKKEFDSGERAEFSAIAFTKDTDKGPEVVAERKETKLEKIVSEIRSQIPYISNIAANTIKYFTAKIFGNKIMGEEYLKEVEKAKAYKLAPR